MIFKITMLVVMLGLAGCDRQESYIIGKSEPNPLSVPPASLTMRAAPDIK